MRALHASTYTNILLALRGGAGQFRFALHGPSNYVASPDYVTRLSEDKLLF